MNELLAIFLLKIFSKSSFTLSKLRFFKYFASIYRHFHFVQRSQFKLNLAREQAVSIFYGEVLDDGFVD